MVTTLSSWLPTAVACGLKIVEELFLNINEHSGDENQNGGVWQI